MVAQKEADDVVVLVDELDNATGSVSKLVAHQGDGMLHRAFSVFIFDTAGRLLIQRRSEAKYHFAGVWANTCCSHPRPGESVVEAAHRRLGQEMGFDCALKELFFFVYRAPSPNGMVEHELDHVLMGTYAGPVSPDPAEIQEWKWIAPSRLLSDMIEKPGEFAPWLGLAAPRVFASLGPA